MRARLLSLLLAGCGRLGFDAAASVDAEQTVPVAPTHVGEPVPRALGTLILGATIDTTALAVDAPSLAGVRFAAMQQPGGRELAVLVADAVVVPAGTTTQVTGARPLVIVATTTITIAGTLDVGAHRKRPGPGGYGSSAGPGAGEDKAPPGTGSSCDLGGGGGGFAATGGAGGWVSGCGSDPALGGAPYGDDRLGVLDGSSGGGAGSPGLCTPHLAVAELKGGGAGGGAVQLTAGRAIEIRATGAVLAGGGGGDPGVECTANGISDAGAGAGGGAGGAIYLEAPTITNDGAVAANGGGGGGGSNGNSSGGKVIGRGAPGADGGPAAGAGGTAIEPLISNAGGAGGDSTKPPEAGQSGRLNPGGGGGAAGRIVIVKRS